MSLYYKLTDGDKLLNPPKQVTFVNLLPFPIKVILLQGEYGVGRYMPLTEMKPKETKIIDYPGSGYGTKITCVRELNDEAPTTMPVQFGYSNKYWFGGVSWNTTEMDTNGYNLYADLPGLRIYNHFPFAVQIAYKNVTFDIGAGTWRGFVGGSPGVVYFDNQGNGLDVGDTFYVKTSEWKQLANFTIPNRYTRNIHIGTTSVP